ncbi:MAG: hypothetical protein WCS73_10710, partial [Lentisphaeria bacterium]
MTCVARSYHVLSYAVTGFTHYGKLTSRISVTKPVCSRLRIAVCSLATWELERVPRDTRSPIYYRLNSKLDGLDFHQLIYKRLLAYRSGAR